MYGYSNAACGFTLGEAFRRPIETIKIASLFIAGPIANQNVRAGECCGLAGILILVPTFQRIAGRRISQAEGVLAGLCLFLLLTSFGVACARISPKWFAANEGSLILPSRYMAIPLLFWGPALALTLGVCPGWTAYLTRTLAAGVVAYLTLHAVPSQFDMSLAWLEYHHKMDVAAAGLIVGVADQTFMYTILPDQERLDGLEPYMKKHRLTFFHDARVSWMDRNLKDLFPKVASSCKGTASGVTLLKNGGFRIEGVLAAGETHFPEERQIVVADQAGKVEGLGCSIVRRTPDGKRSMSRTSGGGEDK